MLRTTDISVRNAIVSLDTLVPGTLAPNDIVEKLFDVIHEDEDFLVINKPAGLVCHPTKTDEYSSLISRIRLYLGPAVHPQLINRLDRETSGITVIGKNEEVARRLRRLWEARQVYKEYLAIVHGSVTDSHQTIAEPLGKDEQSVVAIKECVRADGVPAKTEVWLQQIFNRDCPQLTLCDAEVTSKGANIPGKGFFSLLKIVPHTGRKHQIRVHLAHIGHPIVGDKLYGGDEELYLAFVLNKLTSEQWSRLVLPNHALHASEVRFNWLDGERVYRAGPEPWFNAFCSSTTVAD